MPGDDWSRDEVEATVADYFAMLRDELAGLRVSKSGTTNALGVSFEPIEGVCGVQARQHQCGS